MIHASFQIKKKATEASKKVKPSFSHNFPSFFPRWETLIPAVRHTQIPKLYIYIYIERNPLTSVHMQNKSDSKNHNQTNHLLLTENGRNVDKL